MVPFKNHETRVSFNNHEIIDLFNNYETKRIDCTVKALLFPTISKMFTGCYVNLIDRFHVSLLLGNIHVEYAVCLHDSSMPT